MKAFYYLYDRSLCMMKCIWENKKQLKYKIRLRIHFAHCLVNYFKRDVVHLNLSNGLIRIPVSVNNVFDIPNYVLCTILNRCIFVHYSAEAKRLFVFTYISKQIRYGRSVKLCFMKLFIVKLLVNYKIWEHCITG